MLMLHLFQVEGARLRIQETFVLAGTGVFQQFSVFPPQDLMVALWFAVTAACSRLMMLAAHLKFQSLHYLN